MAFAYKLGKGPRRDDRRDIPLKKLMLATEQLPPRPRVFSVIMNRPVPAPAPQMWGNDTNPDCVEVAMSNHQTYMELTEQSKVIKISTNIVLSLYRKIAAPGGGTIYLDAMNYWRQHGIRVGCKNYKIDAFAAADWTNLEEVKYAIWLLNGLQVGVQLCQADLDDFEAGRPWANITQAPLSDGGHGIYFGGYNDDTGTLTCWSWAREQIVDPAWLIKRGDEAYAAVDSKNSKKSSLNIPLLDSYLKEVTSK